jgi:hypothetical protein
LGVGEEIKIQNGRLFFSKWGVERGGGRGLRKIQNGRLVNPSSSYALPPKIQPENMAPRAAGEKKFSLVCNYTSPSRRR